MRRPYILVTGAIPDHEKIRLRAVAYRDPPVPAYLRLDDPMRRHAVADQEHQGCRRRLRHFRDRPRPHHGRVVLPGQNPIPKMEGQVG